MTRLVRTMLGAAAAVAIATPALAATVTGVTVSPTTLSIEEGSSGTYNVAVTGISGNISAHPPNAPELSYCSEWTIHSDASVTCDARLTIPLDRGRNHTQVPLTAAEILALTRLVTVNADAGATLCGQTFDLTDTLTLPAGSGTAFGVLGSSISRTVQVTVTCASLAEGGCSHGYWKNHQDTIPATWPAPYTPDTLLGTVFTLGPASSLASKSFHDALRFSGGPSPVDKAQLLLLQAVAALLNASDPLINYPLGQADVISQVNAALAGSVPQILALQHTLDGYNNLGSPACEDVQQP
jgi:hypothetical protein